MKKNNIQLNLLNKTIAIARNTNFYKVRLKKYPPKLNNLTEFQFFPFTTKQDLRDSYPLNNIAVSIDKVIEMHTSSGTTGGCTLSYFTKKDLDISSREISKAWECFGINEKSRVQFMMSYGLFSGAAVNTYAIQKLGGFVIPAGIQSAEKQIQMLIDFKVDTIVGTPGYYFYLFDYLSEKRIPVGRLFLKRGIIAGEIYSDEMRMEIEKKFKIKTFDHYGLCEINTGIAYECGYKSGLHILDKYVLAEIIDPETGLVLPDDVEGELVLTTLQKEASPVIRYRTGDITSIKSGLCPCGRTSIRINRIKRRIDDLIFINGIKINPHELKEYIFKSARKYIYNDIKIVIFSDGKKIKPEILVSLKMPFNTKNLEYIKKLTKDKTLINFNIKHVGRDYFKRGENNKTKLVEYVNK